MTENKRFTVDYDITVGNYCLHDDCKSKGVDGYIAFLSDEERANNLCNLLNSQEETITEQKEYLTLMGQGNHLKTMKQQKERIHELETRNNRQYERLKELTDLMFKRDWKTLELMVDEWEKEEEQLQKYGG